MILILYIKMEFLLKNGNESKQAHNRPLKKGVVQSDKSPSQKPCFFKGKCKVLWEEKESFWKSTQHCIVMATTVCSDVLMYQGPSPLALRLIQHVP